MSTYQKARNAKALSSTLPSIIKDKGWERKLDQHRIFLDWKSLVDDEIASHTKPIKVIKDVLWVQVDNSSWLQQFQYQKHYLLELFNEYLKVSRFKDIRFVIEEQAKEQDREKERKITFIPPDHEKVERFRVQIGSIKDEEVRESLMRLWYLAQACRKREG